MRTSDQKTLARVADTVKLQFAPDKTKSLYIRNGGLKRATPPRLRMGDVEIEQVERLRYLGVLYDGKLNFKEHITSRSGRALKLFNAIRSTAPAFFGKFPFLMKRIYLGAIEPMLLYGIGAWGARTEFKYVRMALEAIQRPFLRIITRANKSNKGTK